MGSFGGAALSCVCGTIGRGRCDDDLERSTESKPWGGTTHMLAPALIRQDLAVPKGRASASTASEAGNSERRNT